MTRDLRQENGVTVGQDLEVQEDLHSTLSVVSCRFTSAVGEREELEREVAFDLEKDQNCLVKYSNNIMRLIGKGERIFLYFY